MNYGLVQFFWQAHSFKAWHLSGEIKQRGLGGKVGWGEHSGLPLL